MQTTLSLGVTGCNFARPSLACAAVGVGDSYINGYQVCNLRPVGGAPPTGCEAAGGNCTAISAADIQARAPRGHPGVV